MHCEVNWYDTYIREVEDCICWVMINATAKRIIVWIVQRIWNNIIWLHCWRFRIVIISPKISNVIPWKKKKNSNSCFCLVDKLNKLFLCHQIMEVFDISSRTDLTIQGQQICGTFLFDNLQYRQVLFIVKLHKSFLPPNNGSQYNSTHHHFQMTFLKDQRWWRWFHIINLPLFFLIVSAL